MSDLYEAAVREWIARQLRKRGHQHTRDDIRNVRYGVNEGFHGSDVTPPDDPAAALVCELKRYDRKVGHWSDAEGYVKHQESVEHLTPDALVQELLAIYEELTRG